MYYALHLVKVSPVTLMIIFITTVKCQGDQDSWRNYQPSPFLYKLLNGIQNENTLYDYNTQEVKDDGSMGQNNLDVFSRGATLGKLDKSAIKNAVAPGDNAKPAKISSLQAQAPCNGGASAATLAPSPNGASQQTSNGAAPPAAPPGAPPTTPSGAPPTASPGAPPSAPLPVASPTPAPNSQTPPKPADSKSYETAAESQSNDEQKVHELAKLVEQLYVAQAQVQLEASEIQKAQAIAASAQQALEESANNVRIITEALHTAQQEVATAAIRAQTAQLQLAAHDQLLFAARQRVDALSSQMVGLQAEAGIRPCKVVVDMQDLTNKLKQPLADSQKPTPVPSILNNAVVNDPKRPRENFRDRKVMWNCAGPRCSFNEPETPKDLPERSENDQSLRYIISRGQDLINYNDYILQDKGTPAIKENTHDKRSSEDKSPKHESDGLNERDLKDLYNFIAATDPQQNRFRYEESNINQNQNDVEQTNPSELQDLGILRPALQKSSDRKYIDDFLNKIRNSQKREEKNPNSENENAQETKLVHRDPHINDYIVDLQTKRLSRENSKASQRKKNFAERLTERKDDMNFNFNKDF